MVIGFVAAAIAMGPLAVTPLECRAALLPSYEVKAASGRYVTPLDLATLRDFGRQESSLGGPPPFSVSPDGRYAALVLRRADPVRDTYCMGVMVVALDGSILPRLVDVGGDPILDVSDVRGLADLPIGNLEPVTPEWSPDGLWVAYLRKDGGRTRAWRARVDGSRAEQVSQLSVDVRSVRWSRTGDELVVSSRPGISAAHDAFDAEDRNGFLFDRRFWPLSRARPIASASIPILEQTIAANDGRLIAELVSTADRNRPTGAIEFVRSPHGALAWTAPQNAKIVLGPSSLHVRIGGRSIVCQSPLCASGIGVIWWSTKETLYFLQAGTPENGGITTLARWRPDRDPKPSAILSTKDALLGCREGTGDIVCARETATHPRTLVRIKTDSGQVATVFDPNPDFAGLLKGQVRRLRWRTADGTQSFGDLVLPIQRRRGARVPLVVVQYRSRGFLRGGTGDEYPIYALTARGFAVLSVERTSFVGAGKAKSPAEFLRMGLTNFAERRRTLASIETGVRQAIALGVIDPSRIGITGLSDGAATVQFALVNSDLFQAAAISSCCDEPSSVMFAADRGYSDMLIASGFPEIGEGDADFWRHYSLSANAKRLRTPILMQLPEDEFRFGMETFVTLDKQHVPVEMYVFSDGYHQKWRPAHRLASYERAIDWFDFWLNNKEDNSSAKTKQYIRWRALAKRRLDK